MRALGQIGGREALEAIERLLPNTEGTARAQATFAATLIAHRLGLDGHSAAEPRSSEVLYMATDAGVRVRIRQALSTEVEQSLIGLGVRPYGIELAEHPMYEVRCDRCSGMIMLNREFTDIGALAVLQRRKALFAIGALRSETFGDYSPAALFLPAPTAKGDRIQVRFTSRTATKCSRGKGRCEAIRRLGACGPFGGSAHSDSRRR